MENSTDHLAANPPQTFDDYPVYTGDDLELVYTPARSDFALWAPRASRVRLNLYAAGEGGEPTERLEMQGSEDGVWRIGVERDLKGVFYTFQIEYEGNWLDETPGIWAKAVGVNGNRAAVIDLRETDPEGWAEDRAPELKMYSDCILYELHHRDFSIAPDSGISHKGKFLALTETGTRSPEGEATGLDHLRELGVTHVHILPSFDFSTVDEAHPERNEYNWGYDPQNYNVPEGSYSTDPYDPRVRIREFKQMVQALHRSGLRVVLDVVYNHTATIDRSNFTLTAPGYFYRHNADGSYSDGSGCGDETASEREMMRRYMVESVKYWVREYHIDAFRFDLMGVHDIETMNRIRAELTALDPTIFIYGEGWLAADSPLPEEQRAVRDHARQMPGIAVFCDDFRDAVRGSTFDQNDPGFATGNAAGHTEAVKLGLVGATEHPEVDYGAMLYTSAPYAAAPSQAVNFVASHDGYTLIDKLRLSVAGDRAAEELPAMVKLIYTLLLTAQGVPFLRAGDEIMQDKKGDPNSFKAPDEVNRIDWSLKHANREVFDYVRGLIALRKAHPAFRIPTAEAVKECLHFLPAGEGVVAFTLGEHANGDPWREIVVVCNGNRGETEVQLPEGDWTVVCRDGRIDPDGREQLPGGAVKIAASSAVIAYRE